MDLNNLIPDLELPEISVDLDQEKIEQSQEEPTNLPQDATNETGSETDSVVEDLAVATYEQLKERGYMFSDKEIKNFKDLDDYFDTLPQAVLNSVVESLPEVSKDVLSYIATAGQNITKDELKTFFKTYFEDEPLEVNLETNDSAREFLEQHYKSLGNMKPKAVTAMLDSLEDDDELILTAKEVAEKLKSQPSKTKQLIEGKQDEVRQIQEKQKEFVSKVQTELTSTGWKQDRLNTITKILSGSTLSERLQEVTSNPKGLIQLADLVSYIKNGEFDLDAYKKQAETKQNLSFKEKLEKSQFSSASLKSGQTYRSPNDDNMGDLTPIID